MWSTRCGLLAVTAATMLPAATAHAAEFTWNNSSGDGRFDNRFNWNPSDRPPGALDTAVYNAHLGDPGAPINGVAVPHDSAIEAMQVIGSAIVDLTIGDGATASKFYVTNAVESLAVGVGAGDAATLNLLGGWLDTHQARLGDGATLNVSGTAVLAAHGSIHAFGTLTVHGIPVVHASTLEASPPDCTNGDCPPPPPDCTNGDCPPPPPDCTNGDCPPPPVCTNGGCTTTPEYSNVNAQSISVMGQLLLEGGYVRTEAGYGGLTIAQTGRLAGAGLIEGDVLNAGLFEPGHSPGWILIDGGLLQVATGRLVLEIFGHSQFDQLIVTGPADLGGTLEIVLRNGYLPGAGDEFLLIDADNANFRFDEVLVVGSPLNLSFSPAGLIATGVPEPASFVLLCCGAMGAVLVLTAARRTAVPPMSRQTLP